MAEKREAKIVEWDESYDKPRTFFKKPVPVEAVHLSPWNRNEVLDWMNRNGSDAWEDGAFDISIPTLEGVMLASPTDFIVKGVKGEFYPVRQDIFWLTYEEGIDG